MFQFNSLAINIIFQQCYTEIKHELQVKQFTCTCNNISEFQQYVYTVLHMCFI